MLSTHYWNCFSGASMSEETPLGRDRDNLMIKSRPAFLRKGTLLGAFFVSSVFFDVLVSIAQPDVHLISIELYISSLEELLPNRLVRKQR